ncbi:MAG: M67 family metallopeptidase [Chloroflexi bacterium]|nr:M67 family metallopeptidase [Chloroflexota bacterium]
MKIKREYWNAMRDHVAANAPLEACGLLAGKNDTVEKIFLIANQVQSPVRFRMNPTEQLQAFNWIESNGLELLSIFHSHPAGPETASVTDIEEAAYPVVHIIWSRNAGAWQARGFWIEDMRVTEVTLRITDSNHPEFPVLPVMT